MIKSYEEFWPFYVREHSRPATRALHFVGTWVALLSLVLFIWRGRWYLFPISFVIGYAFAWFAHFTVEKNKPATFKYPLWSFISDHKMMWYMITGRMSREVERAKILGVFLAVLALAVVAQSMDMDRVTVMHIHGEIEISALDDTAWQKAKPVYIANYWSGEAAPKGRGFTARTLWSDSALYVRFEADQNEPLVVSEHPDLTRKVRGLWNRDVCEIFIAPDLAAPNKYFEFEIAPTGEWIDLAIEVTAKERLTDWEYTSKMESTARIGKDKVIMAIKIPFGALGRTPKAGDVWLGNLFRCIGKDQTRGYLAWRPTKTKTPNFHVPAAFGEFEFTR